MCSYRPHKLLVAHHHNMFVACLLACQEETIYNNDQARRRSVSREAASLVQSFRQIVGVGVGVGGWAAGRCCWPDHIR